MKDYKAFDINEVLSDYFEELMEEIDAVSGTEELEDYSELIEDIQVAKIACSEHNAWETLNSINYCIESYEKRRNDNLDDSKIDFYSVITNYRRKLTEADIVILLESFGNICDLNDSAKTEMRLLYTERFGRELSDDYRDYLFSHCTETWFED